MISPKDLASIRVRFAEAPHDTRHRYLGGCRYVPCRAANSRYSSEREAAKRAGDWRWLVAATLVLGHIQKLRKAGIGYKAIAAAAGLAKSTLAMILTGKQAQIRRHHANRILALDRTAIADRALVPAGRTWALLNELLEAGYTKTSSRQAVGQPCQKTVASDRGPLDYGTHRRQRRARAVSELIEKYGGRLVLEAVAGYCFQHWDSGASLPDSAGCRAAS